MFIWLFLLILVYYIFSLLVCLSPLGSVNYDICFSNILFSDLFSSLSYTLNNQSFIFLTMLLICGTISLNYSLHYLGNSGYGVGLLFFNMFVFLVTMVVLTLTSNLVTSLLFWEYLGVVSFLLILFYQNQVGLRAALITLITSRVGDVFLFLLAGYYIHYADVSGLGCVVLLTIFIFVVGSKSAFFPMVSWLLEAMRAPTPVSALVHSSTLVAAGVWFMSEYGYIFYSDLFCHVSAICCFSTIIITFMCSLCLSDVKKIVALSTSNNISWCLLYILTGELVLGLIQLLSHGVGKCIFFSLMGDIMSGNEGGQNYKGYYTKSSGWLSGGLVISLLFLAGAPFIGIYFSKHFFFSGLTLNSTNWAIVLTSYFCLAGTNAYSVRLLMMCLGLVNGGRVNFEGLFLLNLLVLPAGLVINSFLVSSEPEVFSGSLLGSLLLLAVVTLGCLWGLYCFYNKTSLLSDSYYYYSLGAMDWLVDVSILFFMGATNSSNVSLYRWDSSLFKSFVRLFHSWGFVILGISALGISVSFI